MTAALAAVVVPGVQGGAERTKANNGDALNLGSSWSSLPNQNEIAGWTSAVTAPFASSVLGADLTWRGIRISNVVAPISITGSNTLTLGNNGIDMSTALQDLTISTRLNLQAYMGQSWIVQAGRQLTLSGTVTRGTGAVLNVQGAGTVVASTMSNNATGIVGPWATFGTGANTQYLTVNGSNQLVGYASTATTVAAIGAAPTANYEVSALGTFGAGASFNTLRVVGTSGTIAGAFTANGILNSGTGGLTMSGAVRIGANRELVVTTPDGTRAMAISGVISDSLDGPSALVKGGVASNTASPSLGSLTLSGANDYTGVTTIALGGINITNASALGSTSGGTVIISGDNSAPTSSGGTLTIGANLVVNEALTFISGSGNPVGSLTFGGSTDMTLNGTISIQTSAIRMSISTNGAVARLNGGIISNNQQVVFNAGISNARYEVSNNHINLGSGTFYYDSGAVNMNVAGNMWGATTVASSVGPLRTTVSNVMPNLTAMSMGANYSAGGTWELGGTSQTIGEVRSGVFFRTATRTITGTAGSVLTVNQTTNTVADAVLAGELSFVKQGTGTLTLAGVHTTTGSITVNKGTLIQTFAYASVGATGTTAALTNFIPATSPLILGGGTLQLQGRNNGTVTSLAGATWATDTSVISVTSTSGLAPGQLITGGAGLPVGAYVVAVTSATQFIISAKTSAAQGTATGLTVTNTINYTNSQSFNNTTLNAGGSTVSVTKTHTIAAGDAPVVLNLGAVTRDPGATLNFILPTGTQDATNGITSNVTNNASGILGGWATVGSDWATNATNMAGGNVVALSSGNYSDVTRLNGGMTTISTGANAHVRIIDGTGSAVDLTPAAAGTTDIQTLLHTATGGTVTYNPGTTDVLRLGAEGGIMMGSAAPFVIGATPNDGVVTAGGADNTAGTLYLTNQHGSNMMTINSTIANNGSGVVGVVKAGIGSLTLAGTNTYTGKTVIGGGRLIIGAETGLGSNPAAPAADHLTLAGGTLVTTATFALDDGNRGVTVAAAGGTIETSSGTFTIANAISGTGDLIKSGAGTLTLTAANTLSGEVYLNAGTLSVGNVNALQNATLVMGSTVNLAVSGTNTYTIGGLRGSSGMSIGANTLRIGGNNLATSYGGAFSGTGGNVIKEGTAVLNLTGASTHTGTTRVEGGTLGIYNANALQNSTLDTGTAGSQQVIFAAGFSNFNIGGLMGADDLDIGSSNITVGGNNASTTFSGAIIGPFNSGLIKAGTGTLTLSGANDYNGVTTVNAGVLQVGSTGNGRTGTGTVSVAANAQLTGTGVVRGNDFTLANLATLRPGDGVANSAHGTLTFTPVGKGVFDLQTGSTTVLGLSAPTNAGSVDASFGGTWGLPGYGAYVDGIAGAGAHDRLVFNGSTGSTLTFNGTIQVIGDSFTPVAGQVFNLIDWSTTVGVTFDSAFTTNLIRDGLADNGTKFDLPDLNSVVTGLYWDISRFTTSGAIAVIPEPSRALLMLVGGLALLGRRRRQQW